MKNTFVAMSLSLALSSPALAQQKSVKEELVGAWTLISVNSEMDDGTKGEPFGPECCGHSQPETNDHATNPGRAQVR
jgi:hypothetical protein